MSLHDDIKDTLAVNRAVIDQADAWLRDYRRAKNFKPSDTPRSGPDSIAGHSPKGTRPNNKEIA